METEILGVFSPGIPPNTFILKTIKFVQEQLPLWRDDPDRPNEQSEDRLTLQLCKFLNTNRSRNAFPMIHFEHEEYQSGCRSVDFSASPNNKTTIEAKTFTPYDSIVVFECKRLPAPSPARKTEYVTGGQKHTSGGIQRFKLGLHGANDNIAVMVGYIQDGDASDWYKQINEWITELGMGRMQDTCAWKMSEVLESFEEDTSKNIANCRSTHERNNIARTAKISIHHLWVTMGGYNKTSC